MYVRGDSMEIMMVFIGLLIILLIKGIYDEKNRTKLILEKIDAEWGRVPTQEYTDKKFEAICGYYNSIKDNEIDIDDITWNDLDMDEIYMLLNNTGSSIGEEYLYALLRKISFDEEKLEERKRLIHYFQSKKENRKKLQCMLQRFGKLRQYSFYTYINTTEDVEIKHPKLHYLYAASVIISISLLSVSVKWGVILTIACLVHNIIRYTQTKGKIEVYFNILRYIRNMILEVEELSETELEGLEEYMETLKNASKAFKKFNKGANLVVGGRSMTGSISDIILDYIRMIFHIDIMKFNHMIKELRLHKKEINTIYETVGVLDSMIAVASFRALLPEYCEPELIHTSNPFLETANIYHPLIKEPVKNSLSQKQSVLLTGSNASGKSTFLKTIAINQILAQTIGTVFADHYKASYFKIYSSMALQDNIFTNESYYIVEIKSLKRILDQLDDKIPVLCFVDEVLRGTNTLERISASAEILNSFTNHKVLCIAATHDIELTHILEKSFTNYHFQEEVVDNNILFDYKLYKGRAVSKNAIKLLSLLGYDPRITKEATKRANHFIETGEWLTV